MAWHSAARLDLTVSRIYARIWAALVQEGFAVGSHDLIIAATAISLDYTIAMANIRYFEKIPGVNVLRMLLSKGKITMDDFSQLAVNEGHPYRNSEYSWDDYIQA